MLKKLLWVVGILTTWGIVLAIQERHRAKLEAELWASATDQLPN